MAGRKRVLGVGVAEPGVILHEVHLIEAVAHHVSAVVLALAQVELMEVIRSVDNRVPGVAAARRLV